MSLIVTLCLVWPVFARCAEAPSVAASAYILYDFSSYKNDASLVDAFGVALVAELSQVLQATSTRYVHVPCLRMNY